MQEPTDNIDQQTDEHILVPNEIKRAFEFQMSLGRVNLVSLLKNKSEPSIEQVEGLIDNLGHLDSTVAECSYELLYRMDLSSQLLNHLIQVASTLTTHPDIVRRHDVAVLITKAGTQALPILSTFIKDPSEYIRRTAYLSLKFLPFEDSFSLLLQAWKVETNEFILREIVTSIGKYNNLEAIAFVEQAVHSPIEKVQDEAKIQLLEKTLSNSANPINDIKLFIEKELHINPDGQVYMSFVASALAALKTKALPILEQLKKDRSKFTEVFGRIVSFTETQWVVESNDIHGRRVKFPEYNNWHTDPVLWSNNPIEASPDSANAKVVLAKIQQLVSSYCSRYPDQFVGVMLYGSLGFGYWVTGSDVDCGIITTDGKVGASFIADLISDLPKELTKFDPFSSILILDKSGALADVSLGEKMFNGSFIGDRLALQKSQQLTLKKATNQDWNELRGTINTKVGAPDAFNKIAVRHKLSEINAKKYSLLRRLYHVPPPLEDLV